MKHWKTRLKSIRRREQTEELDWPWWEEAATRPWEGRGDGPRSVVGQAGGKLTQSMRLFVWRRVCTRYKPLMTNTRTGTQMTMRGSTGPTPPYQKIHKKENLLINPPSSREEASFSTCERRLNLIKRLVILIIPDWNPRQRGRNHPPDWFLDHSFSSERLTIIHWYSIEYLTLTIPSIDIYVEQFVSHKLTINK